MRLAGAKPAAYCRRGRPAPAGIGPLLLPGGGPFAGSPRTRGDRPSLLNVVGTVPTVAPHPRG